MEELRNHVNELFANEPHTAAVTQAKTEAADRLDTLFTDWLDQGATPAAAAAAVVAQTPSIVSILPHYDATRPAIGLDVPTVAAYWQRRASYARGLATGVGLLVASVTAPLVALQLSHYVAFGAEGFGALAFLGMIAAGVITLVRHVGPFKALHRQVRRSRLSLAAKREARRRLEAYRLPHTYAVCGGLGLFFLAMATPAITTANLPAGDNLGAIAFFAFTALGVALLVYTSTIRRGYRALSR